MLGGVLARGTIPPSGSCVTAFARVRRASCPGGDGYMGSLTIRVTRPVEPQSKTSLRPLTVDR